MRVFYFILFNFFAFAYFSQISSTYLTSKQSNEFNELTKSNVLCVVIENEKDERDAALVLALNTYSNNYKIKYISSLEFNEHYKSNTLDTKQLYLFNNIDNPFLFLNTKSFKKTIISSDGYYLTNDPKKLMSAYKYEEAPPFLVFTSTDYKNYSGTNYRGYFNLLVKYFMYEIEFIKNQPSSLEQKKNNKINGFEYFKDKSIISDKTLLFFKEQVTEIKKNSKNKSSTRLEVRKIIKEIGSSKIVFPEDISYSLKINDKAIVLYNDKIIYSAFDGAAILKLD
ncbi:MAG: hypothetical protein SFY56_00300 [Bacteroidota bacterium]|nr:hypothetical protein [Bacteroidota bacterium]